MNDEMTWRRLRTDLWERMKLNPQEISSPAQDLEQDTRRVGQRKYGQGHVFMRFNVYINPPSIWHVSSLPMSHPCQDITLGVIKES